MLTASQEKQNKYKVRDWPKLQQAGQGAQEKVPKWFPSGSGGAENKSLGGRPGKNQRQVLEILDESQSSFLFPHLLF